MGLMCPVKMNNLRVVRTGIGHETVCDEVFAPLLSFLAAVHLHTGRGVGGAARTGGRQTVASAASTWQRGEGDGHGVWAPGDDRWRSKGAGLARAAAHTGALREVVVTRRGGWTR